MEAPKGYHWVSVVGGLYSPTQLQWWGCVVLSLGLWQLLYHFILWLLLYPLLSACFLIDSLTDSGQGENQLDILFVVRLRNKRIPTTTLVQDQWIVIIWASLIFIKGVPKISLYILNKLVLICLLYRLADKNVKLHFFGHPVVVHENFEQPIHQKQI